MKKLILVVLGCIGCWSVEAQNARITLKMPKKSGYAVSLVAEKLRYYDSPAIGLTDVAYENFGVFDDSTKAWAIAELPLSEPKLVHLNFTDVGPTMGQNIGSPNRLLFVSPGDKLTITIHPDKTLSFEGDNAPAQELMRDCIKENHYEYLPMFGYKPMRVDNAGVLPKIDSLTNTRLARLQAIRSSVSDAFATYIEATTLNEAKMMELAVVDKNLRKGQGVRLRGNDRRTIENITLQNFKVMPDAALMSAAYRSELRNYLQYPAIQRFPVDSSKGFILDKDAVEFAYQLSEQQLNQHSQQREYMLTYWVNYAATFQENMAAAKTLLANYEKVYPQNKELIAYFGNVIAAKEGMYVGQKAPEFLLRNNEGKTISLSSLEGKPLCVAFCFNLKQHELIMKPLEEKYKGRMTFVYLNVTPATTYDSWRPLAETREGVVHLWATEDEAKQLKNTYIPTMKYPLVLIDAKGKIVRRWIPQEFPDNATLQREIKEIMGR